MTEDMGMKDETKVSSFRALKMALADYKRKLVHGPPPSSYDDLSARSEANFSEIVVF